MKTPSAEALLRYPGTSGVLRRRRGNRSKDSGNLSGYPGVMASAVKKTISLPADLARETEAPARAEGKTLSAVVQDALRRARIERRLEAVKGV